MVQAITPNAPARAIRAALAANADGVLVPAGVANVPICFPGAMLERVTSFSLDSQQDDWNPGLPLPISDPTTVLSQRVLLVTPDLAGAELVISGILAPVLSATPGDCTPMLWLYNVGAAPIRLPNLSTDSAAGNRIQTTLAIRGSDALLIQPGTGVALFYASTVWFVVRAWGEPTLATSGQSSGTTVVEVFSTAPLAFDSAVTMRFELTAARDDGGGSAFASFGRRGTFSRAASPGVTLQSGATETFYTEPGATALVADFQIASERVSATLVGIAGQTFRWRARIWLEVSP